jgi:DNA-binding NarL/FixJ family response regulator
MDALRKLTKLLHRGVQFLGGDLKRGSQRGIRLLREGIASLLRGAGFEVVGEAGDAEGLLRLVGTDAPDVAVVDIRMPPSHTDEGIRATHEIRKRFPKVGVLVLSQYLESEFALELIAAGGGAIGYLLKDRVGNKREFAEAVRRVGEGEAVIDPEIVSRLVGRRRERNPLDGLTGRERDVLGLMAEGRSNSAISERLFLSPKTIEAHVRSIFTKLGLEPAPDDHRRVLAVLAYLRS